MPHKNKTIAAIKNKGEISSMALMLNFLEFIRNVSNDITKIANNITVEAPLLPL